MRNELSERPTWVHINFSKIEMMKIFYFRYNFLNGKLILNVKRLKLYQWDGLSQETFQLYIYILWTNRILETLV